MSLAVLPSKLESYRDLEFLPWRDRDLGRIRVPASLRTKISLPGTATRRAIQGEVGVFVAKQHRPVWFQPDGSQHMHENCTVLTCELMQLQAAGYIAAIHHMEMLWHSISHNERVNVGAAIQANRVFGTSGTTANGVFTAIAVANAVLTKGSGNLSLGSNSGGVTTNEFSTLGLARVAGTVGAYTAPAIIARPGAPTVVNNAGGSNYTGGNYRFADTFVVSAGTIVAETDYNASCETGVIAITAAQGASWSNIPTGPLVNGYPSPVVARKLYRTAAGGGVGTEKLVATLSDNITTTFTDNVADATVAGNAAIPTTNTTDLGATFSQVISKVFTATGAATAQGGGLFDQVTVAGSNLYVEDNFVSSASLATNDTLTETITITN